MNPYDRLYNPKKIIDKSLFDISKLDSIQTEIDSMFSSDNKVDSSYDDNNYTFERRINTDKLLVNNVTKKQVNETLQDYYIVIDSNDRDINRYPNPFSYVVFFNDFVNSGNANIQRSFQNVKNIKLETGILPTKYYYTKTDATLFPNDLNIIFDNSNNPNPFTLSFGTYCLIIRTDTHIKIAKVSEYPDLVTQTFDINISNRTVKQYDLKNYSLTCNKYHLLYIDEFSYANEYATNNEVAKSFSILFPDNTRGHNVFYVTSRFKDKEFKLQNLSSINKFTINIADYNGNVLKNSADDYTDKDVGLSKQCTCRTNTDGYFIRNYACACTYFRHPYYHHFQNTLIFKVLQYEKDIDKEIFDK